MLSVLTTSLCSQISDRPVISPRNVGYCGVINRPCPMAHTPAPPSDFCSRETRHEEGDIVPKAKSIFDITLDRINTKSSKDLLYGTVTGWIAGVCLIRVGKVAAFGLGGGIILLHFACECGYIEVNWDRVRDAAHKSQHLIDAVIKFVKKNSCYSVGFVGGFFFGVAST